MPFTQVTTVDIGDKPEVPGRRGAMHQAVLLPPGAKLEVVIRVNGVEKQVIGPWTAPTPDAGLNCWAGVSVRVGANAAADTIKPKVVIAEPI